MSASQAPAPSGNPNDASVNPAIATAHTENRLATAPITSLFAPGGLSIPNVQNPVVLLHETPPAVTRKAVPAFEGAEHTFIGNSITLQFDSGSVLASQRLLTLSSNFSLTYGQILALAGDFYGVVNQPICEDPSPPKRFLAAFQSLANSHSEALKILVCMQQEIDAVNKAMHTPGQQASSAYEQLGDSLSAKWNVITGGGCFATDWFPLGRYLKLAADNWDHFLPWSTVAYNTGHAAAIAQAVKASAISNPTQRADALALAYAMNAFADHFLSDMFSSGHIRVPRKQLFTDVSVSYLGSYCARYMHDEDSYLGLNVVRQDGTKWVAYGDKRFFDSVNQVNASYCEAAVNASAGEIWASYHAKAPVAQPYAAAALVPSTAPFNNPSDRLNNSPMFVATQTSVDRRNSLFDVHDYSWSNSWTANATLSKLKANDYLGLFGREQLAAVPINILHVYTGDNVCLSMTEYTPTTSAYKKTWSSDFAAGTALSVALLSGDINSDGQTEIVQIYQAAPSQGIRVYAPAQSGGYNLSSDTRFIPMSVTALAWLLADLEGEGNVNVVRPWNNGGNLSFEIYKNSGTLQYSLGSANNNLGPLATPVAWLVADVNGDQKQEIVQLWTPTGGSGELGISVYKTDGADGITLQGSWTNLGAGFGAIQWLVGDVDFDGRQEIIQLWNSGNLGITVFNLSSSGAFQVMWSNINMGVATGTPVQAFCGDVNGDGKTEIVRLWNSNNKLAADIFTPGTGGAFTRTWSLADLGEPTSSIAWLATPAGPDLTLTLMHVFSGVLGTAALSVWQTDNGTMTNLGRMISFAYPASGSFFPVDVALS
jgi:hypothetical protein